MTDHLTEQMTQRGFVQLPPIEGNYGGHAQVHASSVYSMVWLDVNEAVDANAAVTAQMQGEQYTGEIREATLLLDKESVRKLAEQLMHLHAQMLDGDGIDWSGD